MMNIKSETESPRNISHRTYFPGVVSHILAWYSMSSGYDQGVSVFPLLHLPSSVIPISLNVVPDHLFGSYSSPWLSFLSLFTVLPNHFVEQKMNFRPQLTTPTSLLLLFHALVFLSPSAVWMLVFGQFPWP